MRRALRHLPVVLAGLLGAAVLAAGGLSWRLAQGPIAVQALTPGLERWLAAGVAGGRARIGQVELVWFDRAQALGLSLHDVSLTDGQGRPVLRARRADVGVALASLASLRPAAGRIAAEDFFAAVSVSPQGRYALGYDASGAPPRGGGNLWRTLDDLVGRSHGGRPLSFLREADFRRGVLALRQVDGPVAWRGRISLVSFRKTSGALAADIDIGVGDAAVRVHGQGALGLKTAVLTASASNLNLARLLPATGATRQLASLDASVQARGRMSWASDRGVTAADVQVTVGPGQVMFGASPAPFYGGELRALCDPRRDRVLIQEARAASAQGEVKAAGQLWLVPESRKTGPASVELALAAERPRLALAPGAAPEALDSLSLKGRYIPDRRRIEIDGFRVGIPGAPLSIAGVLQRPTKPGSWGVDLRGRIDGMMSPAALAALWPDALSDDVRDWVKQHVPRGRLGNADFAMRLAPGELLPHRPMRNERLRLAFDFDDADVGIETHIPLIEHARGQGVLQGDRFDLTASSGAIEGVGLSEALVQIPRLMGDGKTIQFRARAIGDAGRILDVVDKSTSGAPSAQGFRPGRLAGQGDVSFSVGRPMDQATARDYRVVYSGVVHDAVVTDAALGLTLKSAAVKLQGTLDGISARGDVQLGPYRGPLDFSASFLPGPRGGQKASFDGVLDAGSIGLSGPAGSTVRFAAHFDSQAGGGQGVIHSKAFDGHAAWSDGRFQAQGMIDAGAMRGVGVPVGAGVPSRMPARLSLTRSGGGWAGALDADAYSGTIQVSDGPDRRLRYAADLTPAEATRLGLRTEAATGRTTPLRVDLGLNSDAGSASYAVGGWQGQVGWSQAAGSQMQYRWRTVLSPADLHALGLPAGIDPSGPLPVDVMVSGSGGSLSGTAEIGGGSFRFTAAGAAGGARRLSLTGSVDGAELGTLGLGPQGMVAGPAAVNASFNLAPDGVKGGHIDADLQRAQVDAPFVSWRKPAGRAMRIGVDFARHGDGALEATAIRGQGPGFDLSGSGLWRPKGSGVLHIAGAKLEGAFQGGLDIATDADATRLTVKSAYFDARRLLQNGGKPAQPAAGGGSGGAASPAGGPLRIDAQLAQVRVSETALVHNVRIAGDWPGSGRGKLDVSVSRDDGAALVSLQLNPDAAGMAISGKVSDVGEAAFVVFGRRSFRGGTAVVDGRLVQGGADLHVEMTRVRLVQAPALARILTIGSLHGMSDMLAGAGIEFVKVVAPVSVRGARIEIGRARATGPAMGITTEGVIDIDSHTVDLSGGIAPSYVLNSAIGAVPVLGDLLVSHKGEGVFGLTYSAKGPFDAPKISVNPFALAAPGILRRLFEPHAAAKSPAAGG